MIGTRSWRCPECRTVNADAHDDGSPVGACRECFAYRPASKVGRATVVQDRLRAGDKVLGYTLDGNLRPVRRIVR